jgi:hypothetical protein
VFDLERALHSRNNNAFWKIFNRSKASVTTCNAADINVSDFATQVKGNFVSSCDNINAVNDFVSAYNELIVDAVEVSVDANDIECSVKSINQSDCLDCNNMNYGHLLYAHPLVMVSLSLLFNAIFKHGKVPDGFGSSILLPTVKDKCKRLDDVTNYRPISILPIVAKVFERCVEKYFERYFAFHPNQFGFVVNGGCNKALFAFNRTVDYFNSNGSNVYICCLDACKAFDRVNHFALLACMLRRGVPRVLINIFLSWFSNLSGQVRWDSHLSQSFAICSGLPQGSLLSPMFYNFVMDSILYSLQNSGYGCYVNVAFAGAFAYADDLVLLSASLLGLQKLLDVCAEVAAKYDILFNVNKSVAGFVGDKLSTCAPVLELQGRLLSWVSVIKYLGIDFKLGSKMQADLSCRARKFQCAVCAILRNKLPGHESVYVELILKKCMPVLFYGIGVFSLNSNMLNMLSQMWNMAFRFVFGLRKFDSTRLVFQMCNTMSLKYLFDERVLLFLDCVKSNDNALLHNLWCWIRTREWFFQLLARYDLLGVENRFTIRRHVSKAFEDYCDNI